MSYQERRAIIALITTILFSVLYYLYIFQRLPEGSAYSPDTFHFWGSTIVLYMPLSIAVRIAIDIAFSMTTEMASDEKNPHFYDERDRLISLKSIRNSLYGFMIGFLLSMLSLVLNLPPTTMFVIFVISGIISGSIIYISQFYYYHRGF